jgi:hypothetical protein
MEQATLQDRLRWGMNIAARTMGAVSDVFRPRGPLKPLAPIHRILRMHTAFVPRRGGPLTTNVYGDALWHGIFDAAYTQVGDYLVQPGRILFIASQQGLAEPLCVQTNRHVSIARAIPPGTLGINDYGGVVQGNTVILLEDWPASVLGVNDTGNPTAGLPSDVSVPYWTVLMPALSGVILQTGDMLSDDLGRSAVVAACELTEMGWRLAVKQAST